MTISKLRNYFNLNKNRKVKYTISRLIYNLNNQYIDHFNFDLESSYKLTLAKIAFKLKIFLFFTHVVMFKIRLEGVYSAVTKIKK